MAITKKAVLKALSNVQDPDLKQDLVTLNMIKNIKIESKKISFEVVLTTPACPLKEAIRKDCEKVLLETFDATVAFSINMTSKVTTTNERGPLIPQVKNIIAVASGKGGVGKSTTTANLAIALAKTGAKVGIVDADIFGPSIPTMFNCENEKPAVKVVSGHNMIIPIEQYGVQLMSIGFLTPAEDAVVWRGPMASSALKQFISDTKWNDLDYLLIDLPPGTSDIHLTLVQTIPVTGVVIVTTPQKVALADAQKGLAMFKQPKINVPILGIVENMSFFTPEEFPNYKYFIFGEDGGTKFAKKNSLPLLGQIPIVQSIRESSDNGYPAVMTDGIIAKAYMELSAELARQVAIRNANMDKTKVIEVTI